VLKIGRLLKLLSTIIPAHSLSRGSGYFSRKGRKRAQLSRVDIVDCDSNDKYSEYRSTQEHLLIDQEVSVTEKITIMVERTTGG